MFRERHGRTPDRNELARAEAALWPKIKPHLLDAAQSPLMTGTLRNLAEKLHAGAGKMTERAHLDALERILPGGGTRFEWLRSALWKVIPVNERLILGDVGPVALTEAGGFELGLTPPEKMAALLLPVSPHQLVVAGGVSVPFEVSALNRATAELSRDFFVASERTPLEDQLQELIGSRAELLTDEELARLERSLSEDD
jgi:hypothetical protein